MKCRRVAQLLWPHLSDELSSPEAEAVESHLIDCPRCRAEMTAMRKAFAALQSPVRQFEPPDALELVKLKAMEDSPRPFIVGHGLAWASAAAAVMILLLVAVWPHPAQHSPSVVQKPKSPATPTPAQSYTAPKVAVAGPAPPPAAKVRLVTPRSGKPHGQRLNLHIAAKPTINARPDAEPVGQRVVVQGPVSDEPLNSAGEVYVRENGRLYRAMSFTGPDGEIRTVPIRRLPFYDQPRREIDLGDYAVRVARDKGAGTDYVREVR